MSDRRALRRARGPVDVAGLDDPMFPTEPALPRRTAVRTRGAIILKRNPRNRSKAIRAEVIAAYVDDREDELLDAVVTAAALVARADGWVQPVERSQLLDFLDRKEFLSVFARADIIGVFEGRIRELRQPGSPATAVARLARYAGRPPARLAIDAGEEVAGADCRLDPREQRVLQLIRTALGAAAR